MPQANKAVIHVNRQHIQMNAKDGGQRPVYTIKQGRQTTYAQGFTVRGTLTGIDPRSTKQLPCGATAWLVADGEIDFVDPCSFADARSDRGNDAQNTVASGDLRQVA